MYMYMTRMHKGTHTHFPARRKAPSLHAPFARCPRASVPGRRPCLAHARSVATSLPQPFLAAAPDMAPKVAAPKPKTPEPRTPAKMDHAAKIDKIIQNANTQANTHCEEAVQKCKDLKRKLDSDEPDVTEAQAALKTLKKDLRGLAKAEEQSQGENNVAVLVEKITTAHEEALGEVELLERSYGVQDDELLGSEL